MIKRNIPQRKSSTWRMSDGEWTKMKEILKRLKVGTYTDLAYFGEHYPKKIRGFRTNDDEKVILKTILCCWRVGFTDSQIREVLKSNGFDMPDKDGDEK